MQIILDSTQIAKSNPINDPIPQVKHSRFDDFKDRFLAFSHQTLVKKEESKTDSPANQQELDAAAPLFNNQLINLQKNSAANCPQQKNKRKHKQRE